MKIVILMVLSGILEVGGGYGVWRWMREHAPVSIGILGLVGLMLYGVVAALEPLPFGRAYAAYGGVFVLISLLFAAWVDGFRPDRWDLLGAAFVGAGVVMMVHGAGR